MTVTATVRKETWNGSGSAGPFTFNFRFFANSDIKIYKSNGASEVLLTEGVDYTLTGSGTYQGGFITLTTVLAGGYTLTAKRFTDTRQLTSIRNQGSFFPETHEDVFDRLAMAIQDRDGRIDELEARVSEAEDAITGIVGGVAPGLLSYEDATAGPIEYDLPASGSVIVVKVDDSGNEVTILPTIEGQTVCRGDSYVLTVQDETIHLTYNPDDQNWYKAG